MSGEKANPSGHQGSRQLHGKILDPRYCTQYSYKRQDQYIIEQKAIYCPVPIQRRQSHYKDSDTVYNAKNKSHSVITNVYSNQ